jgi:hypothetical protein
LQVWSMNPPKTSSKHCSLNESETVNLSPKILAFMIALVKGNLNDHTHFYMKQRRVSLNEGVEKRTVMPFKRHWPMLAMAGSRLYQLLTKAGERANTDLGPRRLDEKGKEGDLLPREGKTFVMHGRTLENAKDTKAETASMTTRLAVADKVKVLGGPG